MDRMNMVITPSRRNFGLTGRFFDNNIVNLAVYRP